MSRNYFVLNVIAGHFVTSREGCVSRNPLFHVRKQAVNQVTSREGCVSRNFIGEELGFDPLVTSREGCVSRNENVEEAGQEEKRHIPRGMCE